MWFRGERFIGGSPAPYRNRKTEIFVEIMTRKVWPERPAIHESGRQRGRTFPNGGAQLFVLPAGGAAGVDAEAEDLAEGVSAAFAGSLVSAGLDSPLDSELAPELFEA